MSQANDYFFARKRESFFWGFFFSRVSAKKKKIGVFSVFFGVFSVFFCVFVLVGVFFCLFSRVSANFFLGLFFQLSQAKPGIPALAYVRGCSFLKSDLESAREFGRLQGRLQGGPFYSHSERPAVGRPRSDPRCGSTQGRENTQCALYSDPGQRVLRVVLCAFFFNVILLQTGDAPQNIFSRLPTLHTESSI